MSVRHVLGFLALGLVACIDGRLDLIHERSSAEPPSPFVLDDFEDGDTQSPTIAEGYWYFQPDGTCTGSFGVELDVDSAEGNRAIRARGGDCTDWGALLGLDLSNTETFDASSFDELRFRARTQPGVVLELTVSFLNPSHFDASVEATGEWTEYALPLDDFTLDGGGSSEPFDRSALTHLQFFVLSASTFDFWLDEVTLVRSR